MPPSAHIHFEFPGTAFEFLSDAPNAIPAHPNNDFEFIHPVWVNIILKRIGMSSNPQRSLQSIVLGPVTQTGQLHDPTWFDPEASVNFVSTTTCLDPETSFIQLVLVF